MSRDPIRNELQQALERVCEWRRDCDGEGEPCWKQAEAVLQKAKEAGPDNSPSLRAALRDVLDCLGTNEDALDPLTISAIRQGQTALAEQPDEVTSLKFHLWIGDKFIPFDGSDTFASMGMVILCVDGDEIYVCPRNAVDDFLKDLLVTIRGK